VVEVVRWRDPVILERLGFFFPPMAGEPNPRRVVTDNNRSEPVQVGRRPLQQVASKFFNPEPSRHFTQEAGGRVDAAECRPRQGMFSTKVPMHRRAVISKYKPRFERMVQGFYFPRQRITHIYIPAQTYPSKAKEYRENTN
jgi:hypothetical protein